MFVKSELRGGDALVALENALVFAPLYANLTPGRSTREFLRHALLPRRAPRVEFVTNFAGARITQSI